MAAVYAAGYIRTQPAAGRQQPTGPTGPAATTYRDGSYAGDGIGLHGDIQVQVVVRGGHVTSVSITRCGTQYPCSLVAPLQSEVIARQSAQVDLVSRATDSSIAFQAAVNAALYGAR